MDTLCQAALAELARCEWVEDAVSETSSVASIGDDKGAEEEGAEEESESVNENECEDDENENESENEDGQNIVNPAVTEESDNENKMLSHHR